MESKHSGHNSRLRAGIVIAAVHHCWPRDTSPQTVLAYLALPIMRCRRTNEAVVMQRLHHSRSLFFARVVGGGGNQGKRIVEVNQLGPLFSQDRTQLPRSIPGPTRPNPCLYVLQEAVLLRF